MSRIHPTAQIDRGALLADDVEVGPWCLVGPGVELKAGVRLESNVVIVRDTVLGERTVVSPFAVLGGDPQHRGYQGEAVRLMVGADNIIREHVTLHRGTPGGGGVTILGDGCMLMVGSHIAHDCQIGDGVIFANNATVGGHVSIGDGVFMGGVSAVHQFGRIGRFAMVGGGAVVTKDVIPFGSVWGNHARLGGLNMIGLKRRGFDKAQLRTMLKAFQALFAGAGETFAGRLSRVEAEYADSPEVMEMTGFIRAGGHRPICLLAD